MIKQYPLSPFAARCFFLFAFLLFTFALAAAQSSTATLSGTVTDQNGAVVPGAAITLVNDGTTLQRQATTNDDGDFTVALLPPGTYTLNAQRDGFAPVRVEHVVLNVGDQKALKIELKAGSISAQVQVVNEAPLIDTNPAVGTVVDRQFVENIPLNGRSFQSLISLTPGVVNVPVGATAGQFSVNGQRASANNFMVDGVSGNIEAQRGSIGGVGTTGNLPGLTTFGTTQSLVSVDALQEFKVQTSGYSAEFGRQPGGQISIVTRSGTNDFHGSLFDYVRNEAFDANDWFANRAGQPKPPMRQNDFGGTFGGPVMLPGYNGRNRTFFFFSYEGLRLRLPQFSLTNVPTLALRQQAPTGIRPFLNAFPIPNGIELGNGLAEFRASYSDPSTLDATSIRVDHTINHKTTIFARYNKAPSKTQARSAGTNLSRVTTSKLDTQTTTVGLTLSLSPQATNDFRVNYSSNGARQIVEQGNFGSAVPFPRDILIPAQYDSPTAQGNIQLSFPGRTSTGTPTVTLNAPRTDQRQFNIVDNYGHSLGAHQLKFGFDYRKMTPIGDVNPYFVVATFTTSQQILAGTAASGFVATSLPREPVIVNFSAYAQDTWKPSRRLTLDFGVRWEVNPATTEANGNDQLAVTQIDNLATMDLAPLGTKAWKTTYDNFAPRVGLSYLLSEKPGREMVIRGGFGVFYDTGNDFSASNFNQGYPFTAFRALTNVVFPLSPVQVAPPAFPAAGVLTPPYSLNAVFDPSLKLPYTLQWNVAVERSLGPNQTITASYVGATGRRLLQATLLDLSAINPKFTSFGLIRNKASSDYNALQTNFQRRLSRGVQALVSYTWSHALDDDSTGFVLRVPQRGNASFDLRHVFAAAVTYDIPGPSSGRFINALFSHWSIDTRVQIQSAPPLDIVARTFTDPVTGESNNVRPNVITGVPFYLDDPSMPGGRIINNTIPTAAQIAAAGCAPLAPTAPAKGAFCSPPVGQSGNLGRNQIRALPLSQVNLALRREFKIVEKATLQFRAEAFNIFNHPNFGTIQTSLSAANFGQATNMLNRQLGGINQLYQMGGPRSIQFAIRVGF